MSPNLRKLQKARRVKEGGEGGAGRAGKGIVILSVGRSGRELFERRLEGGEPGGVELSRKRTARMKPCSCRA